MRCPSNNFQPYDCSRIQKNPDTHKIGNVLDIFYSRHANKSLPYQIVTTARDNVCSYKVFCKGLNYHGINIAW